MLTNETSPCTKDSHSILERCAEYEDELLMAYQDTINEEYGGRNGATNDSSNGKSRTNRVYMAEFIAALVAGVAVATHAVHWWY